METARLSITNLNKSFSTPVLKNIDLSIARGEVHAIVGENGAGKTTLVNILAGFLRKDGGSIILDGFDYEPTNARDGFNAGISCATQELSTIGTLSVAENIALRNLPQKKWIIAQDELEKQARSLLQFVGLAHVSPDTQTGNLSLGERQLVELAKALSCDCRLLILDEPTAALAGKQADRLHEIITDLTVSGTSVIYVSHRLEDVLLVADTVSILRDGQVVTSTRADALSVPEIIKQMSGRQFQDPDNSPIPVREERPVLEVNKITTKELPHSISFTCHQHEIVGIAGLAGSGRSELLNALFGLASLTGGRVSRCIGNTKITVGSATRAVSCGIGYVGEDRQAMGLFLGQSVVANMTLPGISQIASSLGLLDRAQERIAGTGLVNKLSIKCASLDQAIDELSGGNQQKILIARWIHCDSAIFLLDEPTRGVDIGTKSAIYDLLFELRDRGKTIVIASSEIDELMAVCSRILVLSNRNLVGEFKRGEWSETDILAAAFHEFTGRKS